MVHLVFFPFYTYIYDKTSFSNSSIGVWAKLIDYYRRKPENHEATYLQ